MVGGTKRRTNPATPCRAGPEAAAGGPIGLVKDGDTLYWIARTNCEGNTMEVVDRLVKLYGTDLTIGDTIYLPTHNSCELRMTDGGEVFEDCA